MTTHKFTLDVKGECSRQEAERAVLVAFSTRNPDGLEFDLRDEPRTITELSRDEAKQPYPPDDSDETLRYAFNKRA